MRIWISNTVEDQPWQINGHNIDKFDFAPNLEPSYRVKIEGRLLSDDDGDETGGALDVEDAGVTEEASTASSQQNAQTQKQRSDKLRLSHFFKALKVDLKHSPFPMTAESIVEWKKPDRSQSSPNLPSAADFDELAFKRNGDENFDIIIKLYRYDDPERYEFSPELAEIVGMNEGTRQEAVLKVWEYIKVLGLQEDEEKRNFRCDDLLRKVPPPKTGCFLDILSDISTS